MSSELRLFVWEGFCSDWTDGLAVAIAHNEEEAREMVIKEMGYDTSNWGTLAIYPINTPIAKAVHGGG